MNLVPGGMFGILSHVTAGGRPNATITVMIVTIDVTITETDAVTIDFAMNTEQNTEIMTMVVDPTLLRLTLTIAGYSGVIYDRVIILTCMILEVMEVARNGQAIKADRRN